MATGLLATKLHVPPLRPSFVARPRLVERLRAGLAGKLTLLVAPAGFGKTTLLSEAIGGRPVAWVSLDAGDSDATRFWRYVLAALDRLEHGIGDATRALLESPQPPTFEAILITLLNALGELPTDAVLVLDDYHVIDGAAVHDALSFLLEHLRPLLHLVLATRTDPPLRLARLRARAELTELRAADLRFTSGETAAFMSDVMGLPLSTNEAAALERRTEGWIAGLQLAALAMRGHNDPAGFIDQFTGSNRFVVDYLAEEVFERQPAQLQNFLLQTSILDRLCGPLCDALMLGAAPAVSTQASSQARLSSWSTAICLSSRSTMSGAGIAIISCLPMCCAAGCDILPPLARSLRYTRGPACGMKNKKRSTKPCAMHCARPISIARRCWWSGTLPR